MKIKCKKCKYEWEYMGNSKHYLSCPRCRANIRVVENGEGDKKD